MRKASDIAKERFCIWTTVFHVEPCVLGLPGVIGQVFQRFVRNAKLGPLLNDGGFSGKKILLFKKNRIWNNIEIITLLPYMYKP